MPPITFTVTIKYKQRPDGSSPPGLEEFVQNLDAIKAAHPEIRTLETVPGPTPEIFARSPKFSLTVEFPPELEPAFFSMSTDRNAWRSFLNQIFWIPSGTPRIIGEFEFTVAGVERPGPGTGGSGGGDR